MKKVSKVSLFILIILIILRIINYLSINIFYYIDKSNYTETFKIYGIHNNYIPQGLTYSDKYNVIIQTSYNKENKISKLFISDFDTKKLLKELDIKNIDNSDNTSHVGGISTDNNKLWITNDYSIDEFNLDDVINCGSKFVKPIRNISIATRGDFLTYHDNSLYVGEFQLKPFYKTNHDFPIMIKYNSNTYEEEDAYKIPKMVQGLVIDEDNNFIFSRSYSHFTRSYLNYYKYDDNFNKNNLIKKLKIPPMAEEMFYKDNHLYILFESNADRYFYAIPKVKKILKTKK